MEQTTNLGLNLISESAEDKSMLFSQWRKLVAGVVADSNMKIIDSAYGDINNRLNNIVSDDGTGIVISV